MAPQIDPAHPFHVARAHLAGAREELIRGNIGGALSRVELALTLARESGDRNLVADCLGEQGLVDLHCGNVGEAETRLRASESLRSAEGPTPARYEGCLAEAVALNGDVDRGRERILILLDRLDHDEDAEERAIALCRMARISALLGDTGEAAAALLDAQTLHVLGEAHTLAVTRELSAAAEALDPGRAWRETQAVA